jgi:hypothetical protein
MGRRAGPVPTKAYKALVEAATPAPTAPAEDPLVVIWSEILALRAQLDRIEALLKGRK